MGQAGDSQAERQSTDFPPSGKPRKYLNRAGSLFSGRWPVWLVAVATFTNGLLSILLTLLLHFPENPRLFSFIAPYGLYHFNRSLTVMLGFILIYLSFNLFQRRQIAWWLAAIGCIISLVTQAIDSQIWPSAVIPFLTLLLLMGFRRRFTVHSGWHNIERGLMLASITLIAAVGYGTLGFLLLDQPDFETELRKIFSAIQL